MPEMDRASAATQIQTLWQLQDRTRRTRWLAWVMPTFGVVALAFGLLLDVGMLRYAGIAALAFGIVGLLSGALVQASATRKVRRIAAEHRIELDALRREHERGSDPGRR